MKKILGIVCVLVVGVVLVVIPGRNIIAKAALVRGMKALTGLDVSVGAIDVGIGKSYLSVRDVRLANPAGFADPVMAFMPELYIAYDLGAVLKNKIHLQELRINLEELDIVRERNGGVNINALKALLPGGAAGPAPDIKIALLELTVGKVGYKDYSSGSPVAREFPLNLRERFQNITDPKALVGIILTRALSKTNVAELINFDAASLKEEISAGVGQAVQSVGMDARGKIGRQMQKRAGEAAQKTGEEFKKVFQIKL